MKQRISTLIDFFVRDKVSPEGHLNESEDRLRPGASIRPERLRERRAPRARMRRCDARRWVAAADCSEPAVSTLKIA
jgi:hypothetical protein